MKNPNAPVQLFNLASDPDEKEDLSAQNPGVVQKLKAIMKAAHVENTNFPFIKE
jgi:hypothetical protein